MVERGFNFKGYTGKFSFSEGRTGSSAWATSNGFINIRALVNASTGSAGAAASFELIIPNIHNIKTIFISCSGNGWASTSYASYAVNLNVAGLKLGNTQFGSQLIRREGNFLISSSGDVINISNVTDIILTGSVNAKAGANGRGAEAIINVSNLEIEATEQLPEPIPEPEPIPPIPPEEPDLPIEPPLEPILPVEPPIIEPPKKTNKGAILGALVIGGLALLAKR